MRILVCSGPYRCTPSQLTWRNRKLKLAFGIAADGILAAGVITQNDVGVADALLEARRRTQPIGTPDEIIDKIQTLQQAISLEMVVIHMFYGGMPRAKAEKSLRLFARKVLPAVQAMPTPINPASLGRTRGQAGVTT